MIIYFIRKNLHKLIILIRCKYYFKKVSQRLGYCSWIELSISHSTAPLILIALRTANAFVTIIRDDKSYDLSEICYLSGGRMSFFLNHSSEILQISSYIFYFIFFLTSLPIKNDLQSMIGKKATSLSKAYFWMYKYLKLTSRIRIIYFSCFMYVCE